MSRIRISLVLLVLFAVTLPASVVLSTHLARRTLEKIQLRDQTITVKGYAERRITSDRATWYASIGAQAAALKDAYAEVDQGRQRLCKVLEQAGVRPSDIGVTAAAFEIVYRRDERGCATNQIEGYRVRQPIHLETADVQLAQRVSQAASELIREGIEITSGAPQFHYTKMNDLKLEMLGEASANARSRAEILTGKGSGQLGSLKSASQGVFQITSPLSTDTSDEGISDTGTIDKVIKAVVTLEYAIQ